MTDKASMPPEQVVITHAGLADGSLLADIRTRLPPGMVVRSDAEIAASLQQTLAAHDPAADVWVFGYGSLMWNPAFAYAERRVGVIRGWHRRFCLWLEMGRGSPTNPGLMLALDRGGTCRGVAFRIPAREVRSELLIIWRREMFGTAYLARWVNVHTAHASFQAITFVVNRSHARYAGRLSDAEAAIRIASAAGTLGTCASYLQNTLDHLASLGIRDAGLQRIVAEAAKV
ncbi:gamma-glutamylcyclotransferase [Rhodopila sp.]|uniref:gamma-glutamylcyclotransferase n=1 Tax=Rhodopila sp. TaxID=2480087 RepID=UPI003D0E24ED